MTSKLVKAVIILPGTVLVLVPALLLRRAAGTPLAVSPAGLAEARFWTGLALAAAGLLLAAWTTRLFVTRGEGTPAPWAPPRNLVVGGPYRRVRNPMITGVLLLLAAESLLLGSWPVAGWALVFFLINTIYLTRVEEPQLERRFGEDYRRYRANVPRWIPRVAPWEPG
ncbi:MAG: isoprenylcysteine carboxylmethyltransferase family protein [Gemmatimonadota bacterium]|nr:isoprenylcysteine carboxylmethyltransferase family protein [Gemmatimonadota bacterium]MDE2873441.1 isoprenylcysteine carboxylmethyltransferase family protein [Gemmatimonadota bacterium]